MPKWEDWSTPKLGDEGIEPFFPCLHDLLLIKCLKLTNLPDQLFSFPELLSLECQRLEISIPQLPLLTQLNMGRISRPSSLLGILAQSIITIAIEDLTIN